MTLAVNLAQGASNNVTFRNKIINGAMVIDQRNAGASVSVSSNTYTLDRYRSLASGGGVYSVQQSSTAPAGFVNSMVMTVTTTAASPSAANYYALRQSIEGYNIADLNQGTANAKTFTISFWVRSSLTGTFGGSVDNDVDRSYPFTYTISTANTFEYKTITVTGSTDGTWVTTNGIGINIQFALGVGSSRAGTAGAWASATYFSATGATNVMATNGATLYITGVQLEAGTTASPFEYRQYGTELALCQRYFEKSFAQGTAPAYNQAFHFTVGTVYVGTSITIPIVPFKVTKRAAPTMVMYGQTTSGWRYYAGGFSNLSSFTGFAMDSYFYAEESGTSGLSQFQSTIIGGNWTASAEL